MWVFLKNLCCSVESARNSDSVRDESDKRKQQRASRYRKTTIVEEPSFLTNSSGGQANFFIAAPAPKKSSEPLLSGTCTCCCTTTTTTTESYERLMMIPEVGSSSSIRLSAASDFKVKNIVTGLNLTSSALKAQHVPRSHQVSLAHGEERFYQHWQFVHLDGHDFVGHNDTVFVSTKHGNNCAIRSSTS